MVITFTGNEELDKEIEKNVEDCRIAYYPEYILQEQEADIVILTVQNNRFQFEKYLYQLRKKGIRIVLILEENQKEELKTALQMGIWDIVYDVFTIDEITIKINSPNTFVDIADTYKTLFNIED